MVNNFLFVLISLFIFFAIRESIINYNSWILCLHLLFSPVLPWRSKRKCWLPRIYIPPTSRTSRKCLYLMFTLGYVLTKLMVELEITGIECLTHFFSFLFLELFLQLSIANWGFMYICKLVSFLTCILCNERISSILWLPGCAGSVSFFCCGV